MFSVNNIWWNLNLCVYVYVKCLVMYFIWKKLFFIKKLKDYIIRFDVLIVSIWFVLFMFYSFLDIWNILKIEREEIVDEMLFKDLIY